MQRMASELLATIFLYCLPHWPYLTPDSADAPLVLTRVCRRWREVALSTPRLWCSLSVLKPGYESHEPPTAQEVGMYRRWLSKSGILPLSLEISFDETESWNSTWILLLLPYRMQFKRLRVLLSSHSDLNPLLVHASTLQHLAIRTLLEEDDGLPTRIFQPLPSLNSLVLDGFYPSHTLLSGVAWTQLKSLAISHYAILLPDFLALLSRCPNLESVVASEIIVGSSQGYSQEHLKLRRLECSFNVEMDSNPLTAVLYTPALLDLSLRPLLNNPEMQMEEWEEERDEPWRRSINVEGGEILGLQIINANWTRLTHLEIFAFGDTVPVFHEILRICPNLTDLAFYSNASGRHPTPFGVFLTHRSLSVLVIKSIRNMDDLLDRVILPGLEQLTIACASHWELHTLCRMLERAQCRLRLLIVKGKGATDVDVSNLDGFDSSSTQVILDESFW